MAISAAQRLADYNRHLPGFKPGTAGGRTILEQRTASTGLPYLERVPAVPGVPLSEGEQATLRRIESVPSTYTRVAGKEFAYLQRAAVPHITVDLHSRIPQIIAELPAEMEIPMEMVARRIALGASLNLIKNGSVGTDVPNLFQTIRAEPSDRGEVAWSVGTDVHYAPFVEYGTVRSMAKPYLVPAAEDMADELEPIFAEALADL